MSGVIRTEDFLLLLLAQSDGKLESETRIQKLAFLGIKEKQIPKFTSFVWQKYGPLSQELWKTSKKMRIQGLLKITEDSRVTFMGDCYTVKIFELTKDGSTMVSNLKDQFAEETKAIRDLYFEYGKIPLDRLLQYVHTAYSPDDL